MDTQSRPRPLAAAALSLAAALLAGSGAGLAQEIYLDEGQAEKEPRRFAIPFAFGSETFDFAFGVGGMASGTLQPQATYGWGLMGSSNSSYGAYFGGMNFRTPGTERLFFDPLAGVTRYTAMRSYQDLPLRLGGFDGRAGSNRSDPDDFLEGEGWDVFAEARFRYLLPVGQGAGEPIHTYRLDRGLITDGFTGGGAFNPLTSGRSYLLFTPFYRDRDYDMDEGDELLSASNGFEFGLEWDNRDFVASPSRGNRFKAVFTRDFGWADSSGSYSTWEVEASQYIPLPSTRWARQQVLAFNFWTSDTPTWEVTGAGSVTGRAPEFRSPSLGGFSRMRAFPFYRYNDRSAIYYTAEYRLMPQWNPWAEIGWIDRWLEPDWWQIVPFVEVGRVAPEYDLGTLHEDLQWDAGLSLRFMLKKAVVRFDWAVAEEGSGFWVMFGQPF